MVLVHVLVQKNLFFSFVRLVSLPIIIEMQTTHNSAATAKEKDGMRKTEDATFTAKRQTETGL